MPGALDHVSGIVIQMANQTINLQQTTNLFILVKMSNHNFVYIHIGLSKTSTTNLQTNIFPKVKNENLIYNHKIFYEMADLINLIDCNKIAFDNIEVKIFKEKIDKFLKENLQKRILFSKESLTSCGYGLKNANNRLFLLHYFVPSAKIILFFREHKSWIISNYRQSIQQGNFQSFEDFIYFGDKAVNSMNSYECGILPKLNIKDISYKKLFLILKKYFGKDNLFIFKYEDFLHDYSKNLILLLNLITGIKFSNESIKSFKVTKTHYRSLSGISIKIILLMNYILRPLVKRMNYDQSKKLFNFNNEINYDCNILLKFFSWRYIRIFFQNGLDKIIHLDLNFNKKAKEKLEKYQNFFDEDNYEKLFD